MNRITTQVQLRFIKLTAATYNEMVGTLGFYTGCTKRITMDT